MRRRSRYVALIGTALALLWWVPAYAEAMPECTDKRILEDISERYKASEKIFAKGAELLKELTDARETGFGAPPRSATLYAKPDNYIAESRYCEAKVVLESGATDTVFWRIDHAKIQEKSSYRQEHCALRHDVFQNQCADWRRAQ